MDRRRIRRLQRALRLTLRKEGRAQVFLAGICMTPLLPPGQPVTLEERAPKPGEVVVYETDQGWLAHRVVAVGGAELLIRADRPGSGIERVEQERVVGVWVPRKGGTRARLGLSPTVGRAVQQLSQGLSHPRILPVLGRVRRELRARLPRPRRVALRELEAPTPADLPGLSALGLWHQAVVVDSEEPAGSKTSRPPRFWVVEASARARGGLRIDFLEDRGLIQIALEPLLQGRGFGRALVEAAVAWARREGLTSLHAEIARDNRASRRLFQSAGFSRVARQVGISFRREAPIDAYRLELGNSE